MRPSTLTRLKDPSTVVLIGDFSAGSTEEDLYELVTPHLKPKNLTWNERGFGAVECNSLEDAIALIKKHEAHPMLDKRGKLLKLNYQQTREPWRVLCISHFSQSIDRLRNIFEQHGCSNGVVRITTYKLDSATASGLPPLYFVKCTDIPTAIRIKDKLQDTAQLLNFHVDYGSVPYKEPKRTSLNQKSSLEVRRISAIV
ncbi:hypothetical protein BDY19DRAFT_588292 [Irpex rosettiformis]|uniref:Uncharacterized protein n=1 Tax=Irpex rosettiformis TaxID=378272 RepID=A0ACB8UCZ7_9APHY|nr:hypothetical protein BDY19DRAFT_588292 [Irpex rosettiformis]